MNKSPRQRLPPRAFLSASMGASKTYPRFLFEALFDGLFGARKNRVLAGNSNTKSRKPQEKSSLFVPYLARYLTACLALFGFMHDIPCTKSNPAHHAEGERGKGFEFKRGYCAAFHSCQKPSPPSVHSTNSSVEAGRRVSLSRLAVSATTPGRSRVIMSPE